MTNLPEAALVSNSRDCMCMLSSVTDTHIIYIGVQRLKGAELVAMPAAAFMHPIEVDITTCTTKIRISHSLL